MLFIKNFVSKLNLMKRTAFIFSALVMYLGLTLSSYAYVIIPGSHPFSSHVGQKEALSGSYQDTCSKCVYNSYAQQLSCKCKDDKGVMVNSRSVIKNTCTYVSNKAGFLNCDSYSLYYKKPAGNYFNSCRSCHWDVKTRMLQCDSCDYTVKKQMKTKLQVVKDCMQVENINGSLTCTRKYTHINARFTWKNPIAGNKYLSPGSIYNNGDAPPKCEPITPKGYVWTKQWRTVSYYKHGKFISSVCEYKKAFIPVALKIKSDK